MTVSTLQILVFQTDIRTAGDRQRVQSALDSLADIGRWTVDCEDIDCVLRIEGTGVDPVAVCTVLQAAGFTCAELPD